MDRAFAVSSIARKCGQVLNRNDDIIACLQEAQEELETTGPFLPWFLMTENATKQTILGEERVLLPSDYLRENEQDTLYIQLTDANDLSVNFVPLKKDSLDNMRRIYPDSETGPPQKYTVDPLYFRLRPICNASYPLRMTYFGKDTSITQAETNRWLTYGAPWLVSFAGLKFAKELEIDSAIRFYEKALQEGRNAVYLATEERKHVNQAYYMDN